MSERARRIFWSLCPNLEPSTLRKLFSIFGSASSLDEVTDEDLQARVRLHPNTARSMRMWFNQLKSPDQLEALLNQRGIRCVVMDDEDYPSSLYDLYDPPLVLFVRGEWALLQDYKFVSIVGTRRASGYGLEVTKWVVSSLARSKSAIVSGMALGIDGQAHQTALDEGVPTIAILGCGVDICYPPSHRALCHAILRTGALVSEYAPGMNVAKHRFPERNRIIAAWSDKTVVIQAGEKSGALTTAHSALELGRDVFVVPGPITTKSFRGSHQLLFDGATPIVDPDESFSFSDSDRQAPSRNDAQYPIPSHLTELFVTLEINGPLRAGEVSSLTGIPPSHIYAGLLELELGGWIHQDTDGCYAIRTRMSG